MYIEQPFVIYELQKTLRSILVRPFHHQVQFFRLLSDRINL